MRRLMIALALVLFTPSLCWAKDTWHEGHIVYKHTLAPAVHGVIPPDAQIVLDSGEDIQVSSLPTDDVFRKLIDYWAKERTDYRASPPSVDEFIFRVHGKRADDGLSIEIRYTANGWYGRGWTGITQELKRNPVNR